MTVRARGVFVSLAGVVVTGGLVALAGGAMLGAGKPEPFASFFKLPDARLSRGSPCAIVAHRGMNRFAPENTYASAALCVEPGFAYVEIDVRTTADGVLVVMHDATVDRTTDGSGKVAEMTWDQLRTLDAGSWFGPAYAGQRVPRLDEYLAWAKGKVGVYLDVKDADAQALIDAVNAAGVRDDVFFGCNENAFLAGLRRLDSTIPIKITFKNEGDIEAAANDFNAAILELDAKTMTPERVARVRELGMRPMLYTNKNDRDLFARSLDAGVELFNIDHVEHFAAIEREKHGG